MELSSLLQFLGRLHPLVVHFPIALVLVAAFLQALRWKREPSETVVQCLTIGAAGALVAASCGWLYAEHDPLGVSVESTLLWHRWTGVTAAVLTSASAFLARRARRDPGRGRGLFLASLALSALGVGGGAHLGGELVYGEGYLTEMFLGTDEATEAPTIEAETQDVSEEIESAQRLGAPAQDVFTTAVLPIFSAHCFECHGPRGRVKAGLRLHDEAALFEDDEDLWIVVPGDPDASFLMELITLPADDEDRMPPAEEPPLSAEEIATIRAWIAGMEGPPTSPREGG